MNRLLKKLFRVHTVEKQPEPVLISDVTTATPENVELEDELRASRGRLMQEVSAFEHTASDVRMTLTRNVLAMRGN